MNRIKVKMPDHFTFSTTITIRITDLNYGGHVGNDSFLSLVHEAREQFLLSHGYKELSMEGIGLIMTDAALEYKKELSHGDVVKISVAATDFDKIGFDLFYLMEIINGPEPVIAGKAKTGMAGYDYTLRKRVSMPEAAIRKLQTA
jgi:acyl-CoA thioester hydrolase